MNTPDEPHADGVCEWSETAAVRHGRVVSAMVGVVSLLFAGLIGSPPPARPQTQCPNGTSIADCTEPTRVQGVTPPTSQAPRRVNPEPTRVTDDPTLVIPGPTSVPPPPPPPVVTIPPPPPPPPVVTIPPPPPPPPPPPVVTIPPPPPPPPPPVVTIPPPPPVVPIPPPAFTPAGLELSDSTIGPGGTVTATGRGCVPNAPVSLSIGDSTVGHAVAGPQGGFEVPLATGAFDVGRHQVTAQCGRTLAAPLDVVLASRISTGTSTLTVILVFLLLGVWFYGHRLMSHSTGRPHVG